MLIYVLYGIFILACLALILSVLLQPGKADAGSLFTSSFSSTAFGPRGTQTVLAKISIVSAITFMLVALLISMGVGGYRSVIGSGDTATPVSEATPAPAAETPAQEGAAQPNTNAAPDAPAAGDVPPAAATPAPAASPAPSS
ncbi:MAG TPA: preprotein translocase subunit SecG [Pyrinomonadaceae bacterium]